MAVKVEVAAVEVVVTVVMVKTNIRDDRSLRHRD